TGREATAMIRLSTIQWQWTSPGVPASPQNVPQRFAIDDLQPDTAPRLLASNAGASWLRLRLVDSSGQVLQEESRPPLEGRGSTFELRPFLTTAGTATAASLRLRLELVASSGELLDSTDVAQLARNIEPRDVRAEFDEGGTIIRWVQARS